MHQDFAQQLKTHISSDPWMMEMLTIVRDLDLNDCWIGAGFVRNKIWDVLHDQSRIPLNDIDVIYFDHNKTDKAEDVQLESQLQRIKPEWSWSVKNQARMHIRNQHRAYKNCEEAIAYWPETATAVAVKLNHKDEIMYIAPYGLGDLFQLKVTPTPNFDKVTYKERIQQKNWQQLWPRLTFKELR